jgi:hypothetical protein
MNDTPRDLLHNKLVIVYLDDAFVYSRAMDEYMEHLRLQRFKEEGWKLRLKECFLGL